MNASIEAVADTESMRVLDLSFRITNRLNAAGIFNVGDLCECSVRDLLMMPGFGVKSLREVEQALQRSGRSLRTENA